MSLLMDALKRAEENKQDAARAITRGERPANGGLSLEPLGSETSQTPPVSLPDLAEHIDALDADLAATPTAPPPATPRPAVRPPPPPAADPAREVARNAFAAKATAPESSNRNLWIILGVAIIAGSAIVGYFWYQLSVLNGGSLARAPVATPAPPVTSKSSNLPPQAAPVPIPYPSPPAYPQLSQGETKAVGTSSAFASPPRKPESQTLDPAGPNPVSVAPIRLKRTLPQVDPNVSRGYANLSENTLDNARLDYEQALRNDPRNIDALLALAAIAQRQGRTAEAERYQLRAYEADPKDAAAQAAVVGSANADPAATESRLKSLLAAQPESAPLNFALGNLYSRQNRWPEAQQVYFNAVAADGDNPDYLFNLAVSLDHLRQPKLAAQHYRLALEAAEKRPAAFERERVQRRLRDLQP